MSKIRWIIVLLLICGLICSLILNYQLFKSKQEYDRFEMQTKSLLAMEIMSIVSGLDTYLELIQNTPHRDTRSVQYPAHTALALIQALESKYQKSGYENNVLDIMEGVIKYLTQCMEKVEKYYEDREPFKLSCSNLMIETEEDLVRELEMYRNLLDVTEPYTLSPEPIEFWNQTIENWDMDKAKQVYFCEPRRTSSIN